MQFWPDSCGGRPTNRANEFQGLGSLAYDKGMYILAASHRDQAEIELSKLKHGLLTHTLVIDGLERRKADFEPRDGKIRRFCCADGLTMRYKRFRVYSKTEWHVARKLEIEIGLSLKEKKGSLSKIARCNDRMPSTGLSHSASKRTGQQDRAAQNSLCLTA